jgi:chromosome segregation protein
LRIKKLKLVGFKSFVEPAQLRIENGLTGIVGPNGCGKSNLLEAIRWVMGESSAKSMRGAVPLGRRHQWGANRYARLLRRRT